MDFNRELRTAYFAGIIDGEGYIGLLPNNRAKTLGLYIPKLSVNMTCEKTITSLQEHFNCGTISLKQPKGLSKKMAYLWSLSDANARNVIQEIYPYLITKKENADKVLNYTAPNIIRIRDNQGKFLKVA